MSLRAFAVLWCSALVSAPAPCAAQSQSQNRARPAVLRAAGLSEFYYFEPKAAAGPPQPLFVYLHGRGAKPAEECARWAPLIRERGWLLCPSGPTPHGAGRSWNNSWLTAERAVLAGVQALRARFGPRIRGTGSYTLIGFSEGAYAAMNVGLAQPQLFDKWLILAANTKYWGAPQLSRLRVLAPSLGGVYLLTGAKDGVAAATRGVQSWLQQAQVPEHTEIPTGLGHELALESRSALYRSALDWLAERPTPRTRASAGSNR